MQWQKHKRIYDVNCIQSFRQAKLFSYDTFELLLGAEMCAQCMTMLHKKKEPFL